MPQYLKKVTPEYALKFYNVVIGTPITPTKSQPREINVVRFTTGGGVLLDQLQDNEPVVEQPPAKSEDLF